MSFDNKNEEKDDFWDIDKLVPKKKHSSLSPFATKSSVVEYHIEAENDLKNTSSVRDAEDRKLSFDSIKQESTAKRTIYYPENSLIKSVTISKFNDKYDFYDSFRKSAILYFDCPGEKCEFAQYFSYMPQYSQLAKPQRDYYFYWRSEFRKGRFVKTDYSYLYLYVYEVINLPDLIPPELGIKLLCKLWREYRKSLPRIDLYFCIWVQDYCMVHTLPCPMDDIRDFIFDIIKLSSMKEYYFNDIGTNGRNAVWPILAYLSDYDWTRGLSAVIRQIPDNEQKNKSQIYTELLEGAFRIILPDIWSECLCERNEDTVCRISRSAFPNTLCTHSVKCRLDIEYHSLKDATSLRSNVTGAVRYIENKIRSLFGIKSRIAVRHIPNVYREIIDCYFNEFVEKTHLEEKKRNLPAYEKLYDVPKEELSLAGADQIERMSWNITARLCENEDAESADSEAEISVNNAPICATAVEQDMIFDKAPSDICGLSDSEIKYIEFLLFGGESCVPLIDEEGIVEHINETFVDSFGDIIIENTNDGFKILDDYKGDVTEWFRKITR